MDLNYQIAITSVAFDNSYNNVLRFDSRSEQEAYFNINTLFSSTTPEVNFNVGSLHATNVCFDCGENEALNELLSKNYCIIKDNTPNATLKYYYYFITNAMQDNANRIKMSLELDIFQTYYIDLNFGDNIVYKAHLNRFIDNGNGTVSFDGRPESKLFEREDIQNVAKRMTKRTRLDTYNTGDQNLDDWLNENILCWEYVYLDPLHTYITHKTDYSSNVNTEFSPIHYSSEDKPALDENINSNPTSQLACICVPIYKGHKQIKVRDADTNNTILLSVNALNRFLKANNDNAYVYSIKLTYTAPFTDFNTPYTIEDDGDTLVFKGFESQNNDYIYSSVGYVYVSTNISEISGIANVASQTATNRIFKPKPYITTKDLEFNASNIILDNKNPKYNPKLLSSDYFNIKISDTTENGFDYDLQKLNQSTLNIQSIEPFTPDMTKRYISILSKGGVYIEENSNNLLGFVNNNDTSLLLPTSQYQTMLANNKNYFLQNSINRELSLTQGIVSSGLALAGGIAGKNPLAVIGAGLGMVNTGINYAKSQIAEKLTIDNLKNAPANIQSAKGNPFFEFMYSKYGIIIEEWDILPNEAEMLNDYMCLYGFTYNRVDNIKNVDNIRKYYNYVRANVETISGIAISEVVHKKFKECFANGVRFWNTDTFDYTKENYEQWLENTKLVKAEFNNVGQISQTVTTTTEYGDTTTNSVLYTYKDAILTFSVPAPYMFIIENVDTDATEYSVIYSNVIRYTNATYINIDYKITQGI